MTQVITNNRLLGDGTFNAVVESIELKDGEEDAVKNPNGNHIWTVRFVITPEDGLGDVVVSKTMKFYGGAAFFALRTVEGILGSDMPRSRPFDDELDRQACEGRRVMVRVSPFKTNTGMINSIEEVLPIVNERRRRGMLETTS